jgi:multiple sugar transport system ATP-binding protein
MNFMASKLEQQGNGAKIDIGEREIPLGASVMQSRPSLKEYFGREVIVGIRPQDLEDAAFSGGDQDKPRLKAKINLVEPLGTQTLIHLEVPGRMIVTEDIKELAADIGSDETELAHRAARETVEFIGEIDPKSEVRRGETAELTVDTTRMHFFDQDSGDGIYGK